MNALPRTALARPARVPPAAWAALGVGVACLLALDLAVVPQLASEPAAAPPPQPTSEPTPPSVAASPAPPSDAERGLAAAPPVAAPEPAKSEPAKPEPEPPRPEPAAAPAPEPVARPAPEPVKPAPEPVKPEPEPVKPEPEPVKPEPEPEPVKLEPAPEPVKPEPTRVSSASAATPRDPFELVIYFRVDSAFVSPSEARAIAAFGATASGRRVLVDCFADRFGLARWNQKLSELRCAAVLTALVAGGVAADRVDVAAHGQDETARPYTIDGAARIAGLRRGPPLSRP